MKVDAERLTSYMTDEGIDAWVLYDFRGSNPVFWQLIGETRPTTRRIFLVIFRDGREHLVVHTLDAPLVATTGSKVDEYVTHEQLSATLRNLVQNCSRVAMEYSPGGDLPGVSFVDAGTVELIRGLGPKVVSSADLYQVAAATWTAEALMSHREAVEHVVEIKNAALSYVAKALKTNSVVREFDVQQYIMSEFNSRNLETEDRPIVAVGPHSGDPHYEPEAGKDEVIIRDAVLMLDIWARSPGEHNVFGDVTWIAYTGSTVPDKVAKVFEVVAQARDEVLKEAKLAWGEQRPIHGWELDAVCRAVVEGAGYADRFIHRTGHSLGPGATLHALGMNLDNYETRDTRRLVAGTGFTVEPGIYLKEFGVRLEVDVFVDPLTGPSPTSPVQRELTLLS